MRGLSILYLGLILAGGCNFAKSPEQQAKPSKRDSSVTRLPNGELRTGVKRPAYVTAEPTDSQHATGLNGGHAFLFDPPDYGGEWVVGPERDCVRFFVVDVETGENVAVAASNFFVRTADNQLFSLDPDRSSDAAKSDSFSLIDRNLALAMNSTVELR